MTDFNAYSKGKVYLNNALMAEVSDFSFTIAGNHHDIMTIEKGLAGKANGSPTVDISLTMQTPKTGLEVDLEDTTINGKIVTMSLFMSGSVRSYQGWINQIAFAGSTDNAISYTATFRGSKLA